LAEVKPKQLSPQIDRSQSELACLQEKRAKQLSDQTNQPQNCPTVRSTQLASSIHHNHHNHHHHHHLSSAAAPNEPRPQPPAQHHLTISGPTLDSQTTASYQSLDGNCQLARSQAKDQSSSPLEPHRSGDSIKRNYQHNGDSQASPFNGQEKLASVCGKQQQQHQHQQQTVGLYSSEEQAHRTEPNCSTSETNETKLEPDEHEIEQVSTSEQTASGVAGGSTASTGSGNDYNQLR